MLFQLAKSEIPKYEHITVSSLKSQHGQFGICRFYRTLLGYKIGKKKKKGREKSKQVSFFFTARKKQALMFSSTLKFPSHGS